MYSPSGDRRPHHTLDNGNHTPSGSTGFRTCDHRWKRKWGRSLLTFLLVDYWQHGRAWQTHFPHTHTCASISSPSTWLICPIATNFGSHVTLVRSRDVLVWWSPFLVRFGHGATTWKERTKNSSKRVSHLFWPLRQECCTPVCQQKETRPAPGKNFVKRIHPAVKKNQIWIAVLVDPLHILCDCHNNFAW